MAGQDSLARHGKRLDDQFIQWHPSARASDQLGGSLLQPLVAVGRNLDRADLRKYRLVSPQIQLDQSAACAIEEFGYFGERPEHDMVSSPLT
jgi:hypothetical protein